MTTCYNFRKTVELFIIKLFLGGLSYILVGYALAFGEGSSFIGWNGFLLIGIPFSDYSYVFFQVRCIILLFLTLFRYIYNKPYFC